MIESSFEKLLEALVEAEVKFVTVGGIAVSLNGFVRLTEDVDILISHEKENVTKTIAVISTFGEGYASELSTDDFPLEEGAVRVIEESVGLQVDIFVQMKERSYEDFENSMSFFTSRNGISIPFLNKEGLLYLKSDSVREKDQIDVSALTRMKD